MRGKREDYKKAVKWIAKLLYKHKIKFHFHGGLASYAYGSKLRCNDIDLDMNLSNMNNLYLIAKYHVIEKPWTGTSSNKIWKGCIMQLEYLGIKIDVADAKNTKMFNKKTDRYERFPANINLPTIKKIFGLNVPVMPKKNLINFKSKLRFPNDLIDLKFLNKK